MKVYLSSTFSDLREHRRAALEAVQRLGVDPIALEYFGATPALPIDRCREAVREADVLVLILGHRYGFVPEGEDRSISHLEYHWAQERKIPILAFLLSDDFPVRLSDVERNSELLSRLQGFKLPCAARSC